MIQQVCVEERQLPFNRLLCSAFNSSHPSNYGDSSSSGSTICPFRIWPNHGAGSLTK